jgi:hypothetical protein
VAVPSPRTWVDLDSLDTTNLNGGVRDPMTFVMDKPLFQGRQTVAQSIATSTFVAITFTTGEDIDSEAGHDTGSNTSRYVAQEDGWYRCTGAVVWENNATGRRLCRWTKNGTAVNGSRIDLTAMSVGETIVPARDMVISLSAGDYVELEGWQSSGTNRVTVVTTESQSTMTVEWVRRL